MAKLEQLEASFEWEAFAVPLTDLNVVRLGSHEGELGTLSVLRNDEYGLAFTLESKLDHATLEGLHGDREGTLLEGVPIDAVGTLPFDKISIPKAVVTHFKQTWTVDKPSRTTAEVRASHVTRTFKSDTSGKPHFTTEWFISGPRDFRWSRLTLRERHQRAVRIRSPRGPIDETISLCRPPEGTRPDTASSIDHIRLTPIDGVQLIVSSVPEEHGPKWSRCLAIEYHHGTSPVPADSDRDAIAEALGYLFGRQLLRVGRTSFDEKGLPLEEYACSPWGRDPVRTAIASDLPPLRLGHEGSEAVFSTFVAEYLNRRSELNLREVVWTIWIAQRMPLGFELPLYSTALERLMNAWFRSSQSRSKGVYLPKAEFDAHTRDEFKTIRPRLANSKYGDRIMRKMQNAFQMGVNDRFEVFFEEIGLPIGPGELAVVKARNVSAHGGGTGEDDIQHKLDLARGYQTLLNRVILRVLGCTDSYTDYSTRGHPERRTCDPIGLASIR